MKPSKEELINAYYEKKLNELHKIYSNELPPSFFINKRKLEEERSKALREAGYEREQNENSLREAFNDPYGYEH